MKITELIKSLEIILRVAGDLDVETSGWDGARREQAPPILDYRAILYGRESKPRFAGGYDKSYPMPRKGDPVCRL